MIEECEEDDGPLTETGEALARTCEAYTLRTGGAAKVSCHYNDEDDWHWGVTLDTEIKPIRMPAD